MLYFRGLQQGLARLPAAEPEIRNTLLQDARRVGWAAMHARLAVVDPAAAARIHPNDPQRIQRALEVYAVSGVAMSDLLQTGGNAAPGLPYRLLKLVRAPADRPTLHERIERRFRGMLDLGLVGEVESLWARGDLTPDLPSMRCVGYRQILKYLLGEYRLEEMVHRGIVATRQLAKRQMTWLRAEPDCRWLRDDAATVSEAMRLAEAAAPGV
jgi:tRNA dimethylallyltransferase